MATSRTVHFYPFGPSTFNLTRLKCQWWFIVITALEDAFALKISFESSFLTLNKMVIQIFSFSKIFNNLGIRSESRHFFPRLLPVIPRWNAECWFLTIINLILPTHLREMFQDFKLRYLGYRTRLSTQYSSVGFIFDS